MQTKDVTKLLKIKKERIRYYREQDVFWPEYGTFDAFIRDGLGIIDSEREELQRKYLE